MDQAAHQRVCPPTGRQTCSGIPAACCITAGRDHYRALCHELCIYRAPARAHVVGARSLRGRRSTGCGGATSVRFSVRFRCVAPTTRLKQTKNRPRIDTRLAPPPSAAQTPSPDYSGLVKTAMAVTGSMRLPFMLTDQCRCGPVARPVAPTRPSMLPASTFAPSLTLISLR